MATVGILSPIDLDAIRRRLEIWRKVLDTGDEAFGDEGKSPYDVLGRDALTLLAEVDRQRAAYDELLELYAEEVRRDADAGREED